MHLTGVHLVGVYLIMACISQDMHLRGVHPTNICISLVGLSIGVRLMGVHLMNVPLSWASLAGLSREYPSASAPKPVSSAAQKCVSYASVQEPVL